MGRKALVVVVVVLIAAGTLGIYDFYQKRINLGMGIAEQWASNQFHLLPSPSPAKDLPATRLTRSGLFF
jgi:hypothetical protein